MALPRFPAQTVFTPVFHGFIFRQNLPEICFRAMGYTNLPEFVCWVKAANKITGKALDLLWVVGFLLVGSLPWLDRMVRVGYVCLFPGPA
jgi:hypothetical protein